MSKSTKVVFIKQNARTTEGFIYIRTIEGKTIHKKSTEFKIQEKDWNKYFNSNTERFKKTKQQ
jgi:hypothetical protein